MLELKLPPQDAYYKIKHIIDEVNSLLRYKNMNNIKFIMYTGCLLSSKLQLKISNICLALMLQIIFYCCLLLSLYRLLEHNLINVN